MAYQSDSVNEITNVLWRLQDYKNIEERVYKLPWDMTTRGHRQWSPFWIARRSAQVHFSFPPSCKLTFNNVLMAPHVQRNKQGWTPSKNALLQHSSDQSYPHPALIASTTSGDECLGPGPALQPDSRLILFDHN